MTVTQKLKALRTALDLTQDKFGDILGISGPYYGEVERGRYAVQDWMLDGLNAKYAIDPDEFIDETNDNYLPPGYTRVTQHKPSFRPRPETPKLSKRCISCDYYGGSTTNSCDYILIARQRRGCPAGDNCARYKPRTTTRRFWPMDLGEEVDYDI